MREKNRNSIEKCRKKLPQFTTMNVIEGQAGLVNYSSLIFYSLTLNNILNIIVLLILAGVSIATLTGPNGLLTRANEAKEKTEQAEQDELARLQSLEDYISSVSPTTDGYNETEGVNSPKLAKGRKSFFIYSNSWVLGFRILQLENVAEYFDSSEDFSSFL